MELEKDWRDSDSVNIDGRQRAIDLLERCLAVLKSDGSTAEAALLAGDVADQCDRLAISGLDDWVTRILDLRAKGKTRPQIMAELALPKHQRLPLWRAALRFEANRQRQKVDPLTAESSVERLDLPSRVAKALRRNGVCTIGQFAQLTDRDFRKMANVGEESIERAHGELRRHGFERIPNPALTLPDHPRRAWAEMRARERAAEGDTEVSVEAWPCAPGEVPVTRASHVGELWVPDQTMRVLRSADVFRLHELEKLQHWQRYKIEHNLSEAAFRVLEEELAAVGIRMNRPR